MISKKYIIFIFVILSCLTGCSYFAEKISTLNDPQINELSLVRLQKKTVTQCLPDERISVVMEDENVATFFKKEIKNLFLDTHYSFLQKVIFLTLIEIIRRPDAAGLNSRFQAIVKYNGKIYYFDNEVITETNINAKDLFNPSLYLGLNDILKIQQNSGSLLKLAKILDDSIITHMPVSGEFETFLNENKKLIVKYPSFADVFLKGEETVTRFESFPRNSFLSLIQNYENLSKKSSLKVNSYKELPFQIDNKKSSTIYCNKKLDDSFNDFADYEKIKTHHFAFKDGDNFFIGITSSLYNNEIKPSHDKFYQLNNKPNPNALPLCFIKSQNKEMLVASIEGRNPHQHLRHLFNYEIDLVENVSELNDVFNFSRHLFLTNPDRILYESKKGRKSQLDFFLSKKFPIYHVENLGHIIGFSRFDKKSNLILDSRKSSVLWCHK